MFFTRAQGTREKIDAYVTDLKHKAKDCEFGDLTDLLIRDRIVCRIKYDNVRARLLREADLTLEKNDRHLQGQQNNVKSNEKAG